MIAGLILASTTAFLLSTTRYRLDADARAEARQGLEATLDSLARELRVGGACLPTLGTFVAIAGVDDGDSDELTVRTGLLDSNRTCIRTTLREEMPSDATELELESAAGFEEGMHVYLRHPNGSGEFFVIRRVQGDDMIETEDASSKDYPAVDTGVFAFQERRFAIDRTGARPFLSLAINGGTPLPVADGIETLNVRYRLKRNCPPCDTVDLPADDAEWRLVTSVSAAATAAIAPAGRSGDDYSVSSMLVVKPRNLLP
ncbi:MAG: hypothetical protein ACREQY_11200 [Candidatus Binatia bacterium]